MTAPSLFDLQPTDAELDALDEVLAEIGAWSYPEPGDDEDRGPWDDDAAEAQQLAAEYGLDADELAKAYATEADQLAAVGGLIDLAQATEAQRVAEDDEPLPVRMEDRTAHLLDRIARGTYTPPPMFRDTADLSGGMDPGYGCGEVYDEFGRCASRYHSGYCLETTRSSAATGTHEAASRWNDELRLGTPGMAAVLLANAEYDAPPDRPADLSTYHQMRRILGLG